MTNRIRMVQRELYNVRGLTNRGREREGGREREREGEREGEGGKKKGSHPPSCSV